MTFEPPTRDHIGQELKEIAQAYLDGKLDADNCRTAWVYAITKMCILGPQNVSKSQVTDVAKHLAKMKLPVKKLKRAKP